MEGGRREEVGGEEWGRREMGKDGGERKAGEVKGEGETGVGGWQRVRLQDVEFLDIF